METGDRMLFLEDEPELDLQALTPVTIVEIGGPDDITFQLEDGRTFNTSESSLGPAPDSAR